MSRIKINMYFDDQLIGVSKDWQSLNMRLDFEDERVQPSLETTELEFTLTENKLIRKWVTDGLSGGVGIFEAPDMRVEITDDINRLTVFDGMLDTTNDMRFIDKHTIAVKLRKKGSTNQLTERSQAISFAYLNSLPAGSAGKISDSDFADIPYVLAHIPDATQLILLSISIFIIIKEAAEAASRFFRSKAIVAGDAIDVPPNPVGAAESAILLSLINIAYLLIMVFALIKLIKELIENLLSPVRNFKAMKLQTLLNRGAEHLGYTFSSTFFNSVDNQNLFILPIKENRPDKKGNIVQFDGSKVKDTGFPTNKSQLYTYFDMLEFFKKLINGKTRVINDIIHIERKDFFEDQSTYVLPNVLLLNFNFNTNEIKANFTLQFKIDEKDDTTLTNYVANKTNFQRITEPKVVKNKKNVQIKNLEQVNLPVSLPTRKEKLTIVEQILFDLTAPVDALLDLFKSKERFSDKILARKGLLHLANDFTSVPKLIPMRNGKVHPNYRAIMNAEKLYDDFYFINSFDPDPVNHSQWKMYKDIKIQFCFEDYVALLENSFFTTEDGRTGKFDFIDGNPDGGEAIVDFRIREVYTRNLIDRRI